MEEGFAKPQAGIEKPTVLVLGDLEPAVRYTSVPGIERVYGIDLLGGERKVEDIEVLPEPRGAHLLLESPSG